MPSSHSPQATLTSTTAAWPRLVLGSTSPYRKELLARLGLPFETCSPRTDEQPLPGESPAALALRLAQAKAQDVCQQLQIASSSDVLVIGSDQVAELHGQALGKPGDHQRATEQLRAMRGQEVHFHTAVCVMRPASQFASTHLSTVTVTFRDLSDADIDTYLLAERPYDCAGSAKAETLGIVLLERIVSDDPTALIGLPLIATARLMRDAGADALAWRRALR
ncbi:MAG TPA: Maf family nucleotide pyrophosphatase [Aquabacterium sp.]|uniref:Maf family nucleotide pyrophosphatase n=1 Tax=Aquabacterium sp. TaxID=1872578 RepID=UPI002E33E7B2|nr:Maf family nucleotide pyrophosphatase [Aquabacterium sp.]HEX5356780.1 Maf family nucleotide pyrophosphatase [Aquabacterium sp.]